MITKTLMEALQELYPDSSKTTLRSWIKSGRVLVDGRRMDRADQPVTATTKITLEKQRKILPGGIVILYEDQHIVAIDKPTGLLSVAAAYSEGDTAHAILKAHFKPRRVEVVHRLDQDTSGVMLFALTSEARDALKAMFEKHDLERMYVAVVEGKINEESGTWQSRLIEDANYKVHSSADPLTGKSAITHYHRLARSRHYSWLELTLETGRKNQIRVHCQNAEHPVVGDKKYGAKTNPIKRLALHSYRTSLKHPITGKQLVILSQIPHAFFTLVDPEKQYAH